MFSVLFVFAILINFSIKSNVTCLHENGDRETVFNRVERENVLSETFNYFFKNIKSFLGENTKVLQKQKDRIKSAFYSFFEENTKRPALEIVSDEYKPIRWNHPKLLGNLTSKFSPGGFTVKFETKIEKIISSHGFKPESHTILTADGFMLTVQRVLSMSDKVHKRVAMLHHGLLGSAEDWLLLGPGKSLPYLLVNSGYDVWLLNARGNKYSKIHTRSVKYNDKEAFWDFSFHEIGLYDLPAAIKYISEITKAMEINFVGHSLGSTALLVLLSTLPEYNYILRSAILLGPLAFMYHAKGPIRALTDFYSKNGEDSLSYLGKTEFLPKGSFPEQIIEKYCKGETKACLNPLIMLANGGKEAVSDVFLSRILNHVPAGGSVKTIIHYIQLVKSGYFQTYDYGIAVNVRKYGNSTPPHYDLKKVTLPLVLFSSPSDWLATTSDIKTLLPLLQDVYVHHVVKAADFGHLDFVWSPDAPEFVFTFILSILDQILPKDDDFFQKID